MVAHEIGHNFGKLDDMAGKGLFTHTLKKVLFTIVHPTIAHAVVLLANAALLVPVNVMPKDDTS